MCVVCIHTHVLNNVHKLLHILGRHACMRECVMGVSRSTKKKNCECVLFVCTHVFWIMCIYYYTFSGIVNVKGCVSCVCVSRVCVSGVCVSRVCVRDCSVRTHMCVVCIHTCNLNSGNILLHNLVNVTGYVSFVGVCHVCMSRV